MVITSNTYPAARNTKAQKKIYRNLNSSRSFAVWYKGMENQADNYSKLVNDNLFLNCSDDTRRMGEKTLLAFEWALKNVDFEYLIRPTPSSYVNLDYIHKLIDSNFFDTTNVYAGTVQTLSTKEGNNLNFVSGSTLILNKSSIQKICDNKALWNHDLWDDVALAKLMEELNINYTNIKRFDIKGNIFKQEVDLNNYQYRCRADSHYNYPRFIEAYLLRLTHEIINNKKLSFVKKYFYYYFFELCKIFYVRELSWKIYSMFKVIFKTIVPNSIYKKTKSLMFKKITNFKHKRFKY